jgi:hypothetical protein
MFRHAAAGISTFLVLVVATRAPALTDQEIQAWHEDLEFVRTELPANHPDLFHWLARSDFEDQITSLERRLPSLQPHEVVVELAATVALVRDGHTRVTLPLVEGSGFFRGHASTPPPSDDSLLFHYLPVRFALVDDGLFIRRTDSDHAELLGARVERIGALSVEEAIRRVARVSQHDNEWQLKALAPSRLAIPEILQALGMCDSTDSADLQLHLRSGDSRTVTFRTVVDGDSVEWIDVVRRPPLFERNRSRNFWFEYLETDDVVYCQYNEVHGEEDESVAEFGHRVTNALEDRPGAALLLDIRFNRGGDNSQNREFLRALMRCEQLDRPGGFYVIIGRDTFSAALMFALDLERFTNPIFVGEPTGGRPNHFGDSRKLRLPRSGITLRVSSLYWQYGGPKDDRDAIHPHLAVSRDSSALITGRDPVLERILALGTVPHHGPAVGEWRGRALGYDMVVHVEGPGPNLSASLDLPGEGYSGLPLEAVRYDPPVLSFEFPNGDDTIRFEGSVHSDTVLGRVVERDQAHPWVMTRVR